jgi:hypothetical protein
MQQTESYPRSTAWPGFLLVVACLSLVICARPLARQQRSGQPAGLPSASGLSVPPEVAVTTGDEVSTSEAAMSPPDPGRRSVSAAVPPPALPVEPVDRSDMAACEPPPRAPRIQPATWNPSTPNPLRTATSRAVHGRPGLVERPAGWPRPVALWRLLGEVDQPPLPEWKGQLAAVLDRLEHAGSLADPESADALRQLELVAAPPSEVGQLSHEDRQSMLRLAYAARRRADVWQHVHRLASRPGAVAAPAGEVESLARQLRKVDVLLRAGPYRAGWRDYLLLDELSSLLATRPADRRELAAVCGRVLQRMVSAELTPAQREYLSRPAWQGVTELLWRSSQQEPPLRQLVQQLEDYEQTLTRDAALQLMQSCEFVDRMPSATALEPLLLAIDTHYRNANVRVAISGDLVNRAIPALHMYAEQVQDEILGALVRGQNATRTQLSVRLVPDQERLRLVLDARGQVMSRTASTKGLITLYNQGQSTFLAGKELVVTPGGISVSPTQAAARGRTRLVGLRSRLDDVPLVGWVVRLLARQQFDDQRPRLWAEVRQRVARSARARIDDEVGGRVARVEQRFRERVLSPLDRLELEPEALEMRTTAQRLILRGRLSAPSQLAAHTPRPQARGDSLLSLQLHESAANNLLEQLGLAGQRMTLPELVAVLVEQLDVPPFDLDRWNHGDVRVELASHQPIRFRFDDGRVLLTIDIARLSNGSRVWQDFTVLGYYRADVSQLQLEWVRDGAIQLISSRFGFRDQVAIRAIFTKVLARHHRLQVLERAIARQPNLRNLAVTQFVVDDGWIGISVGDMRGGPPSTEVACRREEAGAGCRR